MSKPKIILVDAFGIGVNYNIADGEENFSRLTRTGQQRMLTILAAAGRAQFATGQITLEQFHTALNERLRTPISMSELVCLWTSTYEVDHEVRGDLGGHGLPPYVWCSNGNEIDFDYLRSRGLRHWSGCRGIFMSGVGRVKSSPAFWQMMRLDLSTRVLCDELAFPEMVMLDTSMENVLCARALGMDARLIGHYTLKAALSELRSAA